jgi:hypothetical protein
MRPVGPHGVAQLAVFVLDQRKQLLMPCGEARARLRLTRGRAVVRSRDRLTVRLKDRVRGDVWPVRIGPGGICLSELAHQRRQSSDTVTPGAINAKCCKLLHCADGDARRPALPPPAEAGGPKRGRSG